MGELTCGAYLFTSVLEINVRHAQARAAAIVNEITSVLPVEAVASFAATA